MKFFFKFVLLLSILVFNIGNAQTSNSVSQSCSHIVAPDMCQKIGQLLIVGFGGFKQNDQGQTNWNDLNGTVFNEQSNVAKDIADQHVGGVILFRKVYWDKNTGQYVKNRNIVNEKQLIELTKALQAYNNKTREQQKLPPLPLIISVDQEGGAINSLAFTNLPNYNAQALGKNDAMHMNDATKHQQALDFTRQYALQTGQLLHRFGINLVLRLMWMSISILSTLLSVPWVVVIPRTLISLPSKRNK